MKLIIWAVAVLTIVLGAALSTADGAGRIMGRVLDAYSNQPVAGATVIIEGTKLSAETDADGRYAFSNVPAGDYVIRAEKAGVMVAPARTVTVTAGKTVTMDFKMMHLPVDLDEAEEGRQRTETLFDSAKRDRKSGIAPMQAPATLSIYGGRGYCEVPPVPTTYPGFESYDNIDENDWLLAIDKPLSTFSADVDAASYGNIRRFITTGQMPPADAVRIEELVNYFDYDYPDPRGRHPFSITTEVAGCPWNPKHKLIHIGLQGERVAVKDLPPSNLVFLIDVSGSMNVPNKLPLLKSSFRLLVDNLREEDRVAIVVYAGAAGLVLPSTSGANKEEILSAIERLQAGGSTAGGAGIKLAYQVAQEHFLEDGNNRVILATDGDFNVGASSDGDMVRLIEEKRKSGVFLTVLGFGQGNLKDSRMEKIANKGNGHYAYIDNIIEAKKVLINELGATLLTIAKDVKLQIEFNPARVHSYRLIGYENRKLQDRDFDDDTKDAGELGAGHSVTALYEIKPASRHIEKGRPMKYMDRRASDEAWRSRELLTVSFRYKQPDKDESVLLSDVVRDGDFSFERASDNFRFSAAVAQFGMILRDSPHRGDATMGDVIATARDAKGNDAHGYRAEFVTLAEMADLLLTPRVSQE